MLRSSWLSDFSRSTGRDFTLRRFGGGPSGVAYQPQPGSRDRVPVSPLSFGNLRKMNSYHIAQINVGRLIAPLDNPQISGFVRELEPINLIADQSDGFIWRLQSDSGNATDFAYSEDPLVIVNMSVWASMEALERYVYASRHLEIFKQRRSWFERMDKAHYCLWWVSAGHRPSIAEGRQRLEHYQVHGATDQAFWFSQPFPHPL